MKIRTASFAAVGATLLVAPSAFAHVEIKPERVPADSFSRFAIHVPTEEPVPTVRVSVKLPASLDQVSFQPKPGWKRTVSGRVVTWSGGEIAPEEADEFVLNAHVPGTAGKALIFPTTQTYANGKVVHWIGAPSSDTPAPRLTLGPNEKGGPPPATTTGRTTTTTPTPSDTTDNDGDGTPAAVWIAIAALLAGAAAFGVRTVRRRRT